MLNLALLIMKKILFSIYLLLSCSISFAQKQKLDLSNSADNLQAYIKTRGSLDSSEEVVFYDEGYIYAMLPEQPIKQLFKFQMYNIARFIPNDSGYIQLTREMLVYEDAATGQILQRWYNPYIKDSVNVIPVWNDPVNAILENDGFSIDYMHMGKNQLCFYLDLPLFYPSPLKKKDWPLNSRSDMYQAAEMFQFFVNEKDLYNKKIKNAPCDIAWTRVCDFLPWMQMGDKPGYLLFSSRGWKLKDGWNDLPQNIKDFVLSNAPEYQHAPTVYTKPNMTSWKYFKKIMEKKN